MISIVYNRKEYHNTLLRTVHPGDTVIEIGPHLGRSTEIILRNASLVVAVDKAKQAEDAFESLDRGLLKKAVFIKGDVRFFETIKRVMKITKTCSVLAVDMGGGRFPDTVFKVWAVWSGVFKPRDSIIRNRGLGEFISRARIEDPALNQQFPDAGWLSQTGRKIPRQLEEGLGELQYWMRPGNPPIDTAQISLLPTRKKL